MPHLDNLGLKENPFIKNNDYRYYYADQSRAQILESTEHLIEFSSNVQVVIGAQGMGKSLLLDTLAHRLENNWRIARIQVNEQVDTLSLIHEILENFGGQINEGEELLEALENQLSEILQLGFKPVLFLDDAHHLSIDSIRFLIQLSQQQQDDEPYIKIVLFADIEITENLQSSELRPFRDNIHIAHLEPLDKEGVSGYLRHKLAIVGFDRESPFTPRIIDSIYKDSQGIPDKIDFFANKFLASSGKGEDYIESEPASAGAVAAENVQDMPWQETDFQSDRIDKAEEQLNRLTEKFDEIEKLTEPSINNQLFDETITDDTNDFAAGNVPEGFNNLDDEDDEPARSMFSRFLIPGAVVGVVLLAIILINTVFDSTSEPGQSAQQGKDEQIELLPLELPVQSTVTREQGEAEKRTEQPASTPKPMPVQETSTSKPVKKVPEISEPVDTTEPLMVETARQPQPQTQPEPVPAANEEIPAKVSGNEPGKTAIPVPELTSVEPEPVIGSNKRQKITITGNNLQQDTRLIVSWSTNSKVFSASQTPAQWHYINNHKVRLELTTGIETQVWQVIAENKDGQRSRPLTFDVVKPFIAKMSINAISPSPVTGSNKRQAITIKGQGFNQQTVIELKWDKNNKHFSARLSPDQFEYISSNEIRLRITTGTKERKWKVTAKDPVSGAVSTASFEVIAPQTLKSSQVKTVSGIQLRDENWIKQQADAHFTLQLFSSYEMQAIERFIKQYGLKGDIARFASKRDGKTWYSLIYGSFATRQAANDAIAGLHPELRKSKPWIRNFASIKQQLSSQVKALPASNQSTPPKPSVAVSKTPAKIKDEAWIWTQSPADYTLQLVALSSQNAIKEYVRQYQLGHEAVYFKFIKDGKPLYVLIYGSYPDKASATSAARKLADRISRAKPWIRRFSDIHSMMSSQ